MTSTNPQLLGVSAALMPDLSGEENIRHGLLAMGLSPSDVLERRNRIADLSGPGDALRMPMRTYSSGMGARLRFAISVASDPEILMIDGALSAGDASFMERSKRAVERMIDTAGTVFLVNHAAKTIEELCTRATWIDQGEIIADSPAVAIARSCRWHAHNLALDRVDKTAGFLQDARQSVDDRQKAIRANARLLKRKSYAEATASIPIVQD